MTLHTKLSFAKSGLRIVGCSILVAVGLIQDIPGLWVAGMLLNMAEIVGVFEELPGAYKGTQT